MQSPDLMESTLTPSSVGYRGLPLPKSFANAAAAATAMQAPMPGSRQPANTSRTNLFIRYLPSEVDDEELRQLFEPFGIIATSMVMRDIHTGESLGTAFVRYESPRDAEVAKRAMDQYPLYNKKLSLQWARREHDFKTAPNDLNKKHMFKLFLRNVPVSATTDDLGHLLSAYGTVVAVSIHADTQQAELVSEGSGQGPRTAKAARELSATPTPAGAILPRRIAFVTFAEQGAAERALHGVHNTCPFDDCDGIPFMGKLINDKLLSKKQQHQQQSQQQYQQHFLHPLPYGGGASQTAVTPRSLPSPASSHGGFGAHSFARSPNTSQGNMSISATEGLPYDAVFNASGACGANAGYCAHPPPQFQHPFANRGCLSRGNSLGADGFGLAAGSRSMTPMSESNSMTPQLRPVSVGDDAACYSNQARLPMAVKRIEPPAPLSQRSLQTSVGGATPLNNNFNNSPASSTPTSSTPSRTRRYSHNPYAALVLQ